MSTAAANLKFLEASRARADSDGRLAEDALYKQVADLQRMIEAEFPFETPTAARALRPESADATKTNPEIHRRAELIKDQCELALSSLLKLELWIQFRQPKIEDGGNFGVGVQESVLRDIRHARDLAMSTSNTVGAPWHRERAKIVKDFCSTVEETTETGDDAAEGADAAAPPAKRKRTEVLPVRTEDEWEYLVATDVNHYFVMRRLVQIFVLELLHALDRLSKNRAKVENPRANDGNSMY